MTIYEALKLPQWDMDLKVGDKLSGLVIEENDLINEPSEIIQGVDLSRFYERQDKLQSLLTNEYAHLARPRKLSDLGILFWIPLIVGLGSFFISGGIWSIRSKNIAAKFFVLSGFALCVSALSSAIYTTRSLALPSDYFKILEGLNAWGATLFAMNVIALFMVYPKDVKGAKFWIALQFCVFSLWTHLFLMGLLPDSAHISIIVMVELVVIAAMIALQLFRFKKDPEARASLLWIGLSVLIGAGSYVALNILPNMFEYEPLDQGIGFLFFLMIYAGIAAGISKYRLFEVGDWAFKFFFYGLGSLFLVLVDALLIYGVGVGRVTALGAAVFIVSLIYLPLRDAIARRYFRQNKMGAEETLRIALNVAFAPNSALRIEKWKYSLSEIFNSLQLDVVHSDTTSVVIENNGISLLIPSVADLPAIRMSYADSGRQLFNHKSEKLAEQLLTLIREAELSRSAYDRGVSEERQRMAQDLHDDVGARLLSGLYSADDKSKSTFHAAIADIRSIVSGMSGVKISLSQLLADLRYETVRRLEAAKIDCHWELKNESDDELTIDFQLQRAIGSIVREITSNVIRHAEAKKLVVQIEVELSAIKINFMDDGVGMPSEVVEGVRQGHGLKILRTRVEKLDGHLNITSDNKGTRIQVQIKVV